MASVVEISPLTRIEGHGSVRIYREGSRVERVDLKFTESPRLFEALLVGKSYLEVPEIVCRICALCSTVHKVTSVLAVEKALGIRVSDTAHLTRELMLNGAQLMDHALHLFCLVLPDLMGVRGVAELAEKAPDLLRSGLAIKKAGNMVQETVGGRLIHPVNIRVGGLGRSLSRTDLLRLKSELETVLPACREVFRLFRTPFPFPELPAPHYLALAPTENPLAAQRCRMTGAGDFEVSEYKRHVEETLLPHSNAKHSRVLGREATVGSLARLTVGEPLTGSAERIFESVKEEQVGRDMRGNNLAQAIELVKAAERCLELIDRLLGGGRDSSQWPPPPAPGRGSAACEAPRGLLVHSYTFDDKGICTQADVITPTAFNQGAMARDLLALAKAMEGEETSRMTTAMERLIRCYDPCISCSVHVFEL